MKFGTKLAFIFILIGAIPLLIGGLFLFSFFDDYLEFSVRNNLEKIAALKTHEINDYLNQKVTAVNHLTEIVKEESERDQEGGRELDGKDYVIDSGDEKEVREENGDIYLGDDFYRHYEYFFDKFLIIDDNGNVFKSSFNDGSGLRWEDTFWFEMARDKKKTVVSDIVFSSVEQEEMFFAFFTPFKVDNDSYMFVAEKSADDIFSILDFRIGESGDVMLVNSEGVVTFSHNKNYRFSDISNEHLLKEINKKDGRSGSVNFNIDGLERVGGFNKIDGLQWIVVVSMVKSDALIFLAQMAINYVFLVIAFLLPIIFISFFTSRKIIKPLKNISLASKRVAMGDFDVKATAKSNDEFGELASNFNKMTVDLKEARKTLEEEKQILEIKVKARTNALKELNENLEKEVQKRTEEMKKKINDLEKMSKLMVGRELKMVDMKKEIEKIKKENKNEEKNNE